MRVHITSLQQQVGTLFANLSSLRQLPNASKAVHETTYSADDSDNRSMPTSQQPSALISPQRERKIYPAFHGPTSSAYGFDVANSTLRTMGITQESVIDETGIPNDRTATASPLGAILPHPSKDPLWSISRGEAIRLCKVYEEEIGIMYPLIDIKGILQYVNRLWTFLEAGLRSGIGHMPGADAIDDDDTNLLKMILAAALILEGSGQSELGQRIFESLKPAITAKFWDPTNTKGLSLLCVAVRYFFSSLFWTRRYDHPANPRFRQSTISIGVTRVKRGASSVLQLGCVWRWASIGENHCSDLSTMKWSTWLQQSFSGSCTLLIDAGALGRECPLRFKTQISIRAFRSP
jgi:hypothetical protein